MTSSKKLIVIKVLYVIYLLLLICFIFSNSIASREESAEVSTGVTDVVNNVIESLGLPFRFEHGVIRKIAHVIEFSVLGASFLGFLILYKMVKTDYVIYSSFFSVIIALTDETIQYFTERGSMVTDVWIDSVSSIFGISIAYLVYYLVTHKRKKG